MSYWDTSALAKLYIPEPDAARFRGYAVQTGAPLVSARLGLLEIQRVVHHKESPGDLHVGEAQTALGRVTQDVAAGRLELVELDAAVEQEFARVLRVCYGRTPAVRLRTFDAVHLASALRVGETEMVSTDTKLREGALALGLTVFPPA